MPRHRQLIGRRAPVPNPMSFHIAERTVMQCYRGVKIQLFTFLLPRLGSGVGVTADPVKTRGRSEQRAGTAPAAQGFAISRTQTNKAPASPPQPVVSIFYKYTQLYGTSVARYID